MAESDLSERHRRSPEEPAALDSDAIADDAGHAARDTAPAQAGFWATFLDQYLNSCQSDAPPSWPEDADDSSIFGGTVTLDPSRVMSAWDRLAQDTWVLEAGAMPHVLHCALIRTLKERSWGN